MPFNVDTGVQQAPPYKVDPVRADLSGATLINGIGDILETAVTGVDNAIHEDISNTLRKSYDLDNTIFGVGGAETMESNTSDAKRTGTDTPQGIKTAFDQLSNAKNAVQQGKLRESNYWSRLGATMRQLRAQYPGYSDDIDKIAERLTGQNPEQATRRALMNEWEKDASSADKIQTERRKNLEQWGEQGWLPTGWEKMEYEDVRGVVYKRRAQDADVARSKSNLELAAAKGQADEKDALEVGYQFARNNLSKQFDDTLRGMGISNWDDAFKKFQEYQSDGVISPEEAQNIKMTFDHLRQASDAAWVDFINKPMSDSPNSKTLASIIKDPNKLDGIRKQQQFELDSMEKNFMDGKFGLFAINKAYYDNQADGVALEASKKVPEALLMGALQKIGGNPAVERWINANPDVIIKLSNLSKSALFHGQMDAAVNGTPLNRTLQDTDKETKVDKTVKATHIQALVDLIKDKDASPDMVKNLAKSLYGQGNLDFMSTAPLNDKDKEIAFRLLTSKEMSSFMFKNKAGDPDGWNNYKKWVTTSSSALYNQAANTLQSYIANKDTPFYIDFDGTKFTINYDTNAFKGGVLDLQKNELEPRGDVGRVSGFGGYYGPDASFDPRLQAPSDLVSAVEKVNTGLQNSVEVAKLAGEDPSAVYKAFNRGLGIDLSAKKNPSFYDIMSDKIQKMWKPAEDSVKQGKQKLGANGNPNSAAGAIAKMAAPVANAIQLASTQTGVDVNLLSALSYVESGGDPNSRTGSYHGLGNLSQGEFNRYNTNPDGDIYNAQDNAMATAYKVKAEATQFAAKYGREPDAVDIYLTHQQGQAGYDSHMNNPKAPAWENIRRFNSSDEMAKRKIWGNMTPEMKANYPGGVDEVTSQDFISHWKNRLDEVSTDGVGEENLKSRSLSSYINMKEVGQAAVDYKSFDKKALQPEVTTALDDAQSNLPFDIVIRSGARDSAENTRVGGAKASQHLSGNAVDISLNGLTDTDRTLLVAQLVKAGFNRLGAYSGNTGLHVDMGKQRKSDGAPWAMFDRTADNMDKAPKWFTDGLKLGHEQAKNGPKDG